ncbi:hypothetical protein VQ056_18605 [Paenibacillus sp. JTLBN-2024]
MYATVSILLSRIIFPMVLRRRYQLLAGRIDIENDQPRIHFFGFLKSAFHEFFEPGFGFFGPPESRKRARFSPIRPLPGSETMQPFPKPA